MGFGEDHLLFRVHGKIFACVDMDDSEFIALKCDPDYAVELRDRYPEIEPAFHWNKKFWNQVRTESNLGDRMLESLIRHSYAEVVKKLPKKVRTEYPEITRIGGVLEK